MKLVDELVSLLKEILKDESGRPLRLQKFRHLVGGTVEVLWSDTIDSILRDLAYDLEYYEPDPVHRKEDASFFGDEKLVKKITAALTLLRSEGIQGEFHDPGG